MGEFEVRVVEVFDSPPNGEQDEVQPRSVITKVAAQDADEARQAWQSVWAAKYGPHRLPVQTLIEVVQLLPRDNGT